MNTPATDRRIRRLLVANRGEITVRIFDTAREMGIVAIAVFSDPDRGAAHVRAADLAISLPGVTSAQTYLDIPAIIAAAVRTNADAIHPGYGFLAENPDFARAVVQAGLIWVGPAPESISDMALKVEAKQIAADSGVPLVPGAEIEEDLAPEDLLARGADVKYPLIVKASAGGGGKGMRIVADPTELVEAVAAARRESVAAFGSPVLFLERYLAGARHVEVQVFGDTHGHQIHLFERECSIQRRHQKVVEESPSPGATQQAREQMCESAVSLARRINYVGAGTVEFLVAGEGVDQAFYFLEMNTRLQVEHRVTELTTGVDLVRWQLEVAAGAALPLTQDEIRTSGHAIEVRLYAEDPANDYLPGAGTIEALDFGTAPGLVVDSGYAAGDQVSPHYDPLIAKLVVSGVDRPTAAANLVRALNMTVARGLPTNRALLAGVVASEAFLCGDTTTAFLAEHPELLGSGDSKSDDRVQLGLVAAALGRLAWLEVSQSTPFPPTVPSRWRNVAGAPGFVGLSHDSEADPNWVLLARGPSLTWDVALSRGSEPFSGDREHLGSVRAEWVTRFSWLASGAGGRGSLLLERDGLATRFEILIEAASVRVSSAEGVLVRQFVGRQSATDSGAGAAGPVAPVPGTVVSVAVEPGQAVIAGDPLVLLEAMKMEHRIVAEQDGVVGEVRVVAGQTVDAHQVLVTFVDSAPDAGTGE